MRVVTKPYGAIEVDDRQRISFADGVLGFESLKDYVLLDAVQPPFYWLQSLDRPDIAFVLIDPRVFRPGYSPDVDREELAEIGIGSEEDLLVLVIVTIPEDARHMTANLQGPLIIHRHTRIARQCISLNPNWGVRHPILEELAGVRQASC